MLALNIPHLLKENIHKRMLPLTYTEFAEGNIHKC